MADEEPNAEVDWGDVEDDRLVLAFCGIITALGMYYTVGKKSKRWTASSWHAHPRLNPPWSRY